MKKITTIGILLSFLICLLEWPPNNSYFVFQLEYQLFFENKNLLQSITHPVILAGVFGHFSLLYAAFTKNPKLWVELTGAILLGLLVVLFLLSGIFSKNVKMILSDLPFILMSSYYYYRLYQEKSSKSRS